jgi:hypothetical protein
MKKVKQPRQRAGKIKFNPDRAVRMYQGGKRVVDIAVAFGYPRGHGQNRVTNALIKAGVYVSRKQATRTSRKARAVPAQPSREHIAIAAPGRTADIALSECYKVVESRYKELPPRSKHGWAERLIATIKDGLIAKKAAA